jgi:ribonuclease-3
MPPPVYQEAGRSGPDHAPQFTVRVTLANGASADASAGSKRVAEQAAARILLERVEREV